MGLVSFFASAREVLRISPLPVARTRDEVRQRRMRSYG